MKTLAVDAESFLVSDEIAHLVQSYHRLLSALGRESEVVVPTRAGASEQSTVSLALGQGTARPSVTDYNRDLAEPDDPDGLADLLEEEALSMLHDMSELYEEITADLQKYAEQRGHD